MLRIVAILLTMFPLHAGINEFLCGDWGHNESAVRLFRRGKACGPQLPAEIAESQIAQLQA